MKSLAANISIRPMRRKDVDAVVGMVGRLAATHGDKTKLSKSFLLKHGFGAGKNVYIHIAFADKTPIGFAQTFDWIKIHRALVDSKLDLLFVEEAWRGKGIGEKLTACAADAAIKRGCARFQTSSAPTNKRAKAFYLNLGFTQRKAHAIDYMIEGKALRQLAKKTK